MHARVEPYSSLLRVKWEFCALVLFAHWVRTAWPLPWTGSWGPFSVCHTLRTCSNAECRGLTLYASVSDWSQRIRQACRVGSSEMVQLITLVHLMTLHLLLALLKMSMKCVCVPPVWDCLLTADDRRFNYQGKAGIVQLLGQKTQGLLRFTSGQYELQ